MMTTTVITVTSMMMTIMMVVVMMMQVFQLDPGYKKTEKVAGCKNFTGIRYHSGIVQPLF